MIFRRSRRSKRGDSLSEDEPQWRVIPSSDPSVAGLAEPGEEFLDPMVSVIDWQEYLATIDERPRDAAITRCRRELALSDRRLVVIFVAKGTYSAIPLAAIRDVSIVKPPWKLFGTREMALRIHFSGAQGEVRRVEFSSKRRLIERFSERLQSNVASLRNEAFWAEHESIDVGDLERMTEAIRLGTEAGEIEVPAILPYREGDSLLPAPVASASRCPVCGGRLRALGESACACPSCLLVWCDPKLEPKLGADGKIEGTSFYPFLPSTIREVDVVHCFTVSNGDVLG